MQSAFCHLLTHTSRLAAVYWWFLENPRAAFGKAQAGHKVSDCLQADEPLAEPHGAKDVRHFRGAKRTGSEGCRSRSREGTRSSGFAWIFFLGSSLGRIQLVFFVWGCLSKSKVKKVCSSSLEEKDLSDKAFESRRLSQLQPGRYFATDCPIDAWEGDSWDFLVLGPEKILHLNATSDSVDGGASWMWVPVCADQTTFNVLEWGSGRFCYQKGKEKESQSYYWLSWAKVAPRDHTFTPCFSCARPASDHEPSCDYQGQQPCRWCNLFPCRHRRCTRKNFGCSFCHRETSGHCMANSQDVEKYQLNSTALQNSSCSWSRFSAPQNRWKEEGKGAGRAVRIWCLLQSNAMELLRICEASWAL